MRILFGCGDEQQQFLRRATRAAGLTIGLAVAACAGRDPAPIPTVQVQDQTASCTQIRAEIEANNIKIQELADEHGWKVAQNVVTGLAGFVVPVTWFGMDWKGAADKDTAALQARQQYLTTLATERCAAPPPPPSRAHAPPQAYAPAPPAPPQVSLPQ